MNHYNISSASMSERTFFSRKFWRRKIRAGHTGCVCITSRNGSVPQFVKFSVIAMFRLHWIRDGEHITLGDGCVNFCKVHVRSEQN